MKRNRISWNGPLLLAGLILPGMLSHGQDFTFEQEPVRYSATESRDPMARLAERIRVGEPLLRGRTDREVLKQLLALLGVPEASQVLVFSKTSAQASLIGPERPRAIYFSEDAYVGWVQGGKIEVTTFDPDLGAVFYLMDTDDLQVDAAPAFARHQSCLNCHASGATGGAPGLLARSVFPSPSGLPHFQAGSTHVTDGTPFQERWGGWYVTGSTGGAAHRGNAVADEAEAGGPVTLRPLLAEGEVVGGLGGLFDPAPYLRRDRSDVLALMILEHQVHVHNTLLSANLAARQAIYRSRQLLRELGGHEPDGLTDSTRSVLRHRAKDIVACLLFRDEAPLPDGGLQGDEAFEKAFLSRASRDGEGRSLRDLRLHERLFKNRCSYLIGSSVFASLVPELKAAVHRQLHAALREPADGDTDSPGHLGVAERRRIREILLATEPEIREAWHRLEIAGDGTSPPGSQP